MMKIKVLLMGAVLITALFASCEKANVDVDTTPIPVNTSGISGEVYGIWTKGSVIRVTGDIIVPVDKSLTIEEGVLVIMDTLARPEFIVKGNLYSRGTVENPVKITIEENYRNEAHKLGKMWGGILGAPTCKELLLDHTILEYGGSTVTEASMSLKLGLYKAAAGENLPALWFSNVKGKLVVNGSTIRHFQEDCTYIEGGQIIFTGNRFYATGLTGGEGINIKSGCIADVSYNLFYSNNTNALKLSNAGDRVPQAHVIAFNNTMLNTGWRRPTAKGGSVWVEASVFVEMYNNLFANTRFGIKRDVKKLEDARSKFRNSLYYGETQTIVNQFQPTAEIVGGVNDVISATVKANDPLFVNYPLSTSTDNVTFNEGWDFHLQAGSAALNKGTKDFVRNFPNGITINGELYSSPEPSSYIGAYGAK
ncbi:right-handed parallel beta-helix repeat-containing protein [Pedobacter sp. MR2016-24]|uniref:right-handed parallel beta-helix repeat-containing protein n=1 Tax=Pedobacter sp. MR2016-24 TaxID=2994466 RepID=UPI0022472AEF|nr:right-handed parallel beta-helix repeat-containing protein [Pedobacter sp. MR2016-24]MCX2483618.1 right-handed parallel beta-helix repeat-containing protein [Pedobacter sp. MR2016-24]